MLIYINGFRIVDTDYNLSTFKSFYLKLLTLGFLSFLLADYYDTMNDTELYNSFGLKRLIQFAMTFFILYSLYYISAIRPFQYNVENVKKQTNIVRKEFGKKSRISFL